MFGSERRHSSRLFTAERLIGCPVLEAVEGLILPNPEIASVKFLIYQPANHEKSNQLISNTRGKESFWLTKAQIEGGKLTRIAKELPENRVLALAGYASLMENPPIPQPELSFGNGSSYYGLFPMIDYECIPSPENLARVRKDLIERLSERFGVIAFTGNSYHYIGGCLLTHFLDITSFCGVQLQLNFPKENISMTDPRNIGHELSTRRRPKGKLESMEGAPVTVTHIHLPGVLGWHLAFGSEEEVF